MRKLGITTWSLTPAAVAVALAVLVCPPGAQAQRRCELPAELTGRTCPVEVCIALQDAVDLACKSPAPTSCKNISGCSALLAMRARWESCRDARVTINATCWGGGDGGHQQAITQANINIANCDARIALPEPVGCADPCP
jgi:hypothetical protein